MSSKIEVSRDLLALYLSGDGGDWVEAGHELRAILAAPVVERQPFGYVYQEARAKLCEGWRQWRDVFDRESPPQWMLEEGKVTGLQPLFTAPPELAELQATITELETKLNNAINLDFERRAEIERLAKNSAEWEAASLHWMAERDQCKSEIERLKGGQASVQTLADKCDNCEKITLGLSGSTKWCAYCGARLTGETVHVSQPTPTQGK